jgi:putative resolvase
VRVSNWCSARGYQIVRVAKEKASGLNGSRRGLTSVLKDPSWSVLVVDTKEVLAPHESDHIILLLEQLDRRVDIVNIAGSEEVFYE